MIILAVRRKISSCRAKLCLSYEHSIESAHSDARDSSREDQFTVAERPVGGAIDVVACPDCVSG
jgi:hypothetical protein